MNAIWKGSISFGLVNIPIALYSAVSTPITWAEVRRCMKEARPEALHFLSDEVLRRVEKQDDLFAGILKFKQRLPPISLIAA